MTEWAAKVPRCELQTLLPVLLPQPDLLSSGLSQEAGEDPTVGTHVPGLEGGVSPELRLSLPSQAPADLSLYCSGQCPSLSASVLFLLCFVPSESQLSGHPR